MFSIHLCFSSIDENLLMQRFGALWALSTPKLFNLLKSFLSASGAVPPVIMTPQETQQLRPFAIFTLMGVVALSAETLFHGIFTLLFAISTAIFLRRGLNTRASWAMFTITIVTYAMSTMYWTSDLATIAYGLKTNLIDQSNLDLAAKIKLSRVRMRAAKSVSGWTSTLPQCISDAVVIWRAWVLFPEQRWVMILPISMLVGTTGMMMFLA